MRSVTPGAPSATGSALAHRIAATQAPFIGAGPVLRAECATSARAQKGATTPGPDQDAVYGPVSRTIAATTGMAGVTARATGSLEEGGRIDAHPGRPISRMIKPRAGNPSPRMTRWTDWRLLVRRAGNRLSESFASGVAPAPTNDWPGPWPNIIPDAPACASVLTANTRKPRRELGPSR